MIIIIIIIITTMREIEEKKINLNTVNLFCIVTVVRQPLGI